MDRNVEPGESNGYGKIRQIGRTARSHKVDSVLVLRALHSPKGTEVIIRPRHRGIGASLMETKRPAESPYSKRRVQLVRFCTRQSNRLKQSFVVTLLVCRYKWVG